MAPACPILLPGGAVCPAINPTIGFVIFSFAHRAASFSICPPISPINTTPSVSLSFSNKKNLRILETGYIQKREDKLEVRNLDGGLLIQGVDTSEIKIEQLETVTDVSPDETDIENMLFGWRVLKHIKSNAILLVKNKTSVGIGGGQVSRVDAVDIAIKKSGERISQSILCSDAFFPFRDSIDKIANTGIKAIIQPGGSIRDNEVVSACNEHRIAMVFTGKRCFKH